MPPLIYIAGPYSAGPNGLDYMGIEANIAKAREAAKWLVENGFYFFCPHLNSAHFECIAPDVPVQTWYDLDIRLLKACDAMLLVGAWESSKGVAKEIEVARDVGIPVFTAAWTLTAWSRSVV
mgnify:CR=1 FL=1